MTADAPFESELRRLMGEQIDGHPGAHDARQPAVAVAADDVTALPRGVG